jgi:hypothetical protein
MLPKARELDIDFEALGQRMLARKKELLKDGVPSYAEHAMVAKSHGRADSPAAAAARRKSATRKAPAKAPPFEASVRHEGIGETWQRKHHRRTLPTKEKPTRS